MVENHSSFVAVGFEDILPQIVQVHALLLSTKMLQVDCSTGDVSHLAFLPRLV